jgi:hypothetical protein
MLSAVYFWTNLQNLERVHSMLKENFGMVGPKDDYHRRSEKDILVYEEQKNGIYRVHFKYMHKEGPNIGFRYWRASLTPAIRERDPMKDALRNTYELLKPVKVTDIGSRDIDLELLLRH